MTQSLGRVPSPPDARDENYRMAPRLALLEEPLPGYRYWTTGPILDQGQEGACVGFSFAQWMLTSPIRHRGGDDELGRTIYRRCKAIDGHPGEGTYVRAGAEIMRADGRLREYVWGRTIGEIANWVLRKGPVVIGVPWLADMFDPDANGVLKVSGPKVGGHALLIRGFSLYREQFRLVNSWGRDWGQNGQAWIDSDDLWRLIDDGGEACAGVEVRP